MQCCKNYKHITISGLLKRIAHRWTVGSRNIKASYLVGHRQSACGCLRLGSTLLSMARVKHVVFPLPLCACIACQSMMK